MITYLIIPAPYWQSIEMRCWFIMHVKQTHKAKVDSR